MDRRDAVLAMLALGAVPIATKAQQRGKTYRIGVLDTTSAADNATNLNEFLQGLRELGYVEGQNLEIVYRSFDGISDRFPDLARELVRQKVDLILTRGTPAALAAKNATSTIPVVMAASGNPVNAGIVESLGRPGGNVTGLSAQMLDLYAKRVELLKELLPKLKRIAGLCNMSNAAIPSEWKYMESSARSLGVATQLLDVRRAEDMGRAFDAAATQRADALVVWLDGVMGANKQFIIERAAKQRLPAIYASADFVDAGGLISYGVSYPALYRKAAAYTDRIFKGARPAELPVEQPTKFELAINLKTAKALGIAVPRPVLLRADRVIE
jgi:putative ABC transport system substrate-binding protein